MFGLPYLLYYLTGVHRYQPKITWSKTSWTHNIFRIFELIFWRKEGIRLEMTHDPIKGVSQAHTFEALCALVENQIREVFKFRLPKIKKVYIPLFAPVGGYPVPSKSPYFFAIAFDNSEAPTPLGPLAAYTWAHTITGSDMLLWVGGRADGTTDRITGITYALVAMTESDAKHALNSSYGFQSLWYLAGPTTGTNNVVVTFSPNAGWVGFSSSYSGCSQTGIPDAYGTALGTTADTLDVSATVVATDCWMVTVFCDDTGAAVAPDAGFLTRESTGASEELADSDGTVGTGAQTCTWTAGSGNTTMGALITSFAPAAAAAGSTRSRMLMGIGK